MLKVILEHDEYLLRLEAKLGYKLEKREKLIEKNSVEAFAKKLQKQEQRLLGGK